MKENPYQLLKLESLSSLLSHPKLHLSLSDVNVIIIPFLMKHLFLWLFVSNFNKVYCFAVLMDLATETAKYVFPKRFESQNLEEALMAGSSFFFFWVGFDWNFIVYLWGVEVFCLWCTYEFSGLYIGFCVVPDLETVNFKVLSRRGQYEIREVEVHKYNCL